MLENALDYEGLKHYDGKSKDYIDEKVSGLQTQVNNKVDKTTTINGKTLSDNITLSASDVGADINGAANSALEDAKTHADTAIKNALTQNLKMTDDAGVTKTVIELLNPTPETPTSGGSEVLLRTGGNIFLGAGESSVNLRKALSNTDTLLDGEIYGSTGERAYVSGDRQVILYSDCNTIAERKALAFGYGTLTPFITGQSIDLGKASNPFNKGYFNEVIGNLTGGVNAQIINTANTNLDDYKTPGIYYFSGSYKPTNIPAGSNGILVVLAPVNAYVVKQLWFRQGTANSNDYYTYVRMYASSTWSTWTRFITDKDKISSTKITTEKNFLLIGDSYLAGYTPDGTIDSWGILLSQMLPQHTFNIQYITGSGFGTTKANKNFLDALKAYSGDKNTITDILICGGYNDVKTSITNKMIATGMLNFMTYAKTNFPNAKIHLGFCGACSRSDAIYNIKDTVLMYQSCGNYGAGYISNMEYTVKHTRFLTSDKVHPNLLGQKNIAWNLASYIVSGNASVIQQRLNCDVVHDSTVTAGIELFTSMNNETATLYHPDNQVITFSGLSSMTLNSKPNNRIHLGTLTNTCIMGSQLGDTVSTSNTNAVVTVPVLVLLEGNSVYMNGICTLEIMNLEVYLRLGVLNSNGKYIAGVVSTVILPPFTATFDSLDV